jgi:hypothetical protein
MKAFLVEISEKGGQVLFVLGVYNAPVESIVCIAVDSEVLVLQNSTGRGVREVCRSKSYSLLKGCSMFWLALSVDMVG